MWNLLPLTTKRHSDLFQRTHGCRFCKSNDELNCHSFFSCSKLQGVWELVSVWLFKLTGYVANLPVGLCLYLDVQNVFGQLSQNQEAAIIFHLSVAKHSIWLHRNSIAFNEADFCLDDVVVDLKKKIGSRFMAEKHRNIKDFHFAISNLFYCLSLYVFYLKPMN